MNRRIRLALTAVPLSVLLSGCMLQEGEQFNVWWNPGDPARFDVVISLEATTSIVAINDSTCWEWYCCWGSEYCTLSILGNSKWKWIARAADISYFFDDEQWRDFNESLNSVRCRQRCLTLSRNPFNYVPGADRRNWTYRDKGHAYCLPGFALAPAS